MGAFRKFVFVICFIICIVSLLGLLVFSVFASYKGGGDTFPSLYGMLSTDSSRLFKGFSYYLSNSLTFMDKMGIGEQIIYGVLLLSFIASPLLIVISIILVIYYFNKALKLKITGSLTLAIAEIMIVSSQLNYVFFLYSGLDQIYFSEIRNGCAIAAIISTLLLSEIVPQAKYEFKISITNKIFKIAAFVISGFLLQSIWVICVPKSFLWLGIFTVLALELLAFILFESLYVKTRYGLAITLANAILISVIFIIYRIINQNSVDSRTVELIVALGVFFAIWGLLAIVYTYCFNRFCALYSEDVDRTMSGFGNNREVQPQKRYYTGFDATAFLYFAKLLFGALIVGATMLAANYLVRLLLVNFFELREEWIALLSNVVSLIAAAGMIYLLFDSTHLPFDWFYYPEGKYMNAWYCKNATSCSVFVNTILLLIIGAFAIPIIISDFTWTLYLAEARWPYLFVSIIAFLISRMVMVNIEIYVESCVRCHFIATYEDVSSWKGTATLKRHTRRVDGHYVTDRSTSTTTYNTSTSGSSDIHVQGHGQVGFTLDKSESRTSATTNTTTQRWVDGYVVDEGLYEHQTRYTQKRCVCCGFTFTRSSESSHLVG